METDIKLWEEKNLTVQLTNLLKNAGKDNFDIITEIKNLLTKNESPDISTIKSGIYLIVNKINGKYYVGRSYNVYGRWVTHRRNLRDNKHPNDHLQHAWNKDGESNFEFIKILDVEPIEHSLILTEQKFLDISKNRQDTCYNLNFDAFNCAKLSKYSCEKISKFHKGRKFTEEHKRKISLSRIGKSIPHTLETKRKMSLSHIGKQCGVKNGMFGKTFSSEQKEKWSIERSGKNNSNFNGKNMTVDVRKRISNTLKSKYKSGEIKIIRTQESKNKVTGINNKWADRNIYTFRNVITNETYEGHRIEFQKKFNLNFNCLSALVRGKAKHTRNWILINKKGTP